MNNFKDFNISTHLFHLRRRKDQSSTDCSTSLLLCTTLRSSRPKKKEGTECLTIQIEKGGEKRIIFTGSKVLIDQIRRVPANKFPFTTVIRGDQNDHYEFT